MESADLAVVIIKEAEVEAVEAFEWYREEAGDEIAHGFRLAVRGAVARVKEQPELYPKFEGEVRRCLFGRYPYALLYEVTEAAIIILAFMHMKRRPGYWKSRRAATRRRRSSVWPR